MFIALSALDRSSAAAELDRGAMRLWILVVLGVALLIATGIGAMLVGRLGRRMKKSATELGWAYRREGTPVPVGLLAGFPFGGLSDTRVDHDISGLWRNHRARAFVLRASPPGYSARFQVTMLEIARPMPTVELHPRSNLQRNFDIESEVAMGSAEFDKRWRVACRDPQVARAIVTPRLMERLLAERSAVVPVTIDNASVYTWAPVHRAARHDMQASLALLADVASIVVSTAAQLDHAGVPLANAAGSASPLIAQPSHLAPKPRKNRGYLAILSVILPLTIVLLPLGIVCGHAALWACRRGEASNHRWAVIGLVFGYGMLAIFLGVGLMGVLAY